MGYRVYQTNKKSGVTYVYEAVSYWDKEKKQPRNRQVCIGKLDPETKDFIPSKSLDSKQAAARDPEVTASAEIVGPTIVLDAISERLGLSKLLKKCLPTEHLEIMSMAYYLAAEGGALSHCETWSKSHAHPLGSVLSSQCMSKILSNITTDHKQTFLSRWMEKSLENDYLCYDITSVSSYSKLNEYIKHGYNRDGEKLPQMNIAMLFGQNSGLPVYFQRMPGNITDVTTLRNLVKTFKALDFKAPNYVMDKGFYSKKNVDDVLSSRSKFTVAVPLNNKWVHKVIDGIGDIHGPEGYRKLDDEIIYVHSSLYPWGKDKRRCYLHLYYNAHARAIDIDRCSEKLVQYKNELEQGKPVNEHQEADDNFYSAGVGTTLSANRVYTLIGTYSAGTLKFYVDGVLKATTTSVTDPYSDGTNKLAFGGMVDRVTGIEQRAAPAGVGGAGGSRPSNDFMLNQTSPVADI